MCATIGQSFYIYFSKSSLVILLFKYYLRTFLKQYLFSISCRSLKHSSTSLAPLQSVPSSASLRSISPSRRSASSNSSSTAKHEQSPAAPPAAAGAGGATTSTGSSSSNHNITPPEKEKKRKEVSSSRVKKFQRHFSQVSQDEKLINCKYIQFFYM